LEPILSVSQSKFFSFKHADELIDKKKDFRLHYHPYPEIYLFVKGVATYYIEGSIYQLEPYDIILVPAYMIHQPYPQLNTIFERYVLNVFPSFYEHMSCPEYEKRFLHLDNFMYKIPGRIVKKTNMLNILNDLRTYSNNYKNLEIPVIMYKIGEFLHVLNSIDSFEAFNTQNPIIQKTIDYIDENYASINNLDELSNTLNYTKSYLCSIFKEKTGMTISHYLNTKRIERVKMLYGSGKNLSTASIEAGFGTYGNFAYNYKKIFGKSPKEDLK